MTSTRRTHRLALRGNELLHNPRWNKGTAFTIEERKEFGLRGRLPSRANTLDEQCGRAYAQFQSRGDAIHKNTFLHSLKEQNWVLYYGLIARNLKEMTPIIYTPTQGDAIAQYSHLFRRSEGLFLHFPDKDKMEEDYLEQTKGRTIDLVVVTDSEAILGIGDQGVGISTAKSAIYTLLGGVNPSNTLAVVLDVGTDNQDLLNDKLYVGWPHKRVRGKEYDEFVDKFVQLVRKHHPHCLLHFEDFGVSNAQALLERYNDTHAVFNDDIQGTGAVTLAALMTAVGVTKSTLADQRIVVYGAGSAGLGITRQIRDAMVQADGLSVEEANKRFYLLDRFGLIKSSLPSDQIRPAAHDFVRPAEEWDGVPQNNKGETGLLDVVKTVRPTVLIGCSTQAGAFTKDVITTMKEGAERPIIFSLSNPSRLVEVDPKDANDWTGGMALLATGSPFPPAKMPNGKKDYIIAECNNALIYPGLGYGALLCKSRRMTDKMIIAGAQRLASLAPALKDPDDALLPDFDVAPHVNFEIAVAVAEQAFDEGIADVSWGKEETRKKAEEGLWRPVYEEYKFDKDGVDW
ncbi:hypothetical protein CONPUDRAFT_87139 [Coniophora puteana RWD-64-598 SS2]|uniref:Malic enzyme n=1 Tax=Coniophora puteana (strain RWD-64-598) TaxID=741705 RepID=A0A5M3N8X9_CONPW|nr:uncharacterized protein CONPUDRAFT_87139 [Coniophora puteana RWD-64-598 SS2]EIW87295.1 hypothetical protein CONPUDRAFT_87139 [Coniophora puteana RWD-64-598 SS2]